MLLRFPILYPVLDDLRPYAQQNPTEKPPQAHRYFANPPCVVSPFAQPNEEDPERGIRSTLSI